MDEVVAEFLVESYENLDQLDRDLMALESDPSDLSVLGSVFRTIHTVKGTCGFLGFGHLEHVAHVGESLLARLRDGELAITPAMADALLQLSDAVRAMLGEIERTGAEGHTDHSVLVALLTDLNTSPTGNDQAAPPAGSSPSPLLSPAASRPPATLPGAAVPAESPLLQPANVAARTESTIRVDIEVLDAVMDLVGELVLTRNRIGQLVTSEAGAELGESAQRLSHLTTELQEAVTRTRMQPVGTVWGRVPRLVRDLASNSGKQVRVETEGDDTELDKSVVEAVKDPLTHMVRNAVDHGIESPEERVAAGKPAEGRLLLRASHQAGQVIIEISDDGGGIDPGRIAAKALEKGIVTQADVARMTDADILQLIFAAGFSTAEQVTNVSGRGVGMDVVRTNIERIGGRVELASVVGAGSTFTLRIPLTLAIMPALGVSCGDAAFAVPQGALVEVLRIDAEERKTAITRAQGTPVLRWRDALLPLVDLRAVLGLPVERPEVLTVLVLQAEGRTFGLTVDRVEDTAEIVVKPLGAHLEVDVLAGATILGDGRVSLILDITGLAHRAAVVRESKRRSRADDAETGAVTTPVLVCRTPVDARLGLPLDQVARLLEVPSSSIERVAGGEAIQHGGSILRVIRVADLVGAGGDESLTTQLVLAELGGETVALHLGRVVDVLDAPLELEPPRHEGLRGSCVLQGRVTDVVDLAAVLSFDGAAVPAGV